MKNCSTDGASIPPYAPYTNVLLDPSRVFIGILSLLVIVYGSFRNMSAKKSSCDLFIASLNTMETLCMILMAISFILFMFLLFFDSLHTVMAGILTINATSFLAYMLQPMCKFAIRPCTNDRCATEQLLSVVVALAIVCAWFQTGHWVFLNVIGIGFCVTFWASMQISSLKVATLIVVAFTLFSGFVLCVFLIWHYFDANLFAIHPVPFENPVELVGRKFNLSVAKDSPAQLLHMELRLPCVLHPGLFSSIGIVELLMPGVLLCFVLRYDVHKMSQGTAASADPIPSGIGSRLSYFHCSLWGICGFCLGLITSTLCSVFFNRIEPDLLYLIPFTLIPVLASAYYKGELRQMWSDPFQKPPAPEYLELIVT